MKLVVRDNLLPAEYKTVRMGFIEYNASHGHGNERYPLALALYTAEKKMVGALAGYIAFNWLTVSRLWVVDTQRGVGLGTRLMQEAHTRARVAGCIGCTLSTHDYQAKPFYEKMG